MTKFAPDVLRKLNGLFAVYKPPHKSVPQMRVIIKKHLIEDLNSMEQPQPPKKVVFEKPKSLPLTEHCDTKMPEKIQEEVVLKEDWFYHPAVQGPTYSFEDLILHYHSPLDDFASGVQVFGIGQKGRQMIKKLNEFASTNVYDVHGRFGEASIGFADTGRVVDRSTHEHIHRKAISRLLNMIVGRYRTTNITASNIDLDTQHAYEMASSGILRPANECPYMIYHGVLKKLKNPDFVVELTCYNEEIQFLKSITHEIGLELQTTALCTKVRRSRSFIFHALDDTTILNDLVTTDAIINSIEQNQAAVETALQALHSTHLVDLDLIKLSGEDLSNSNERQVHFV